MKLSNGKIADSLWKPISLSWTVGLGGVAKRVDLFAKTNVSYYRWAN